MSGDAISLAVAGAVAVGGALIALLSRRQPVRHPCRADRWRVAPRR